MLVSGTSLMMAYMAPPFLRPQCIVMSEVPDRWRAVSRGGEGPLTITPKKIDVSPAADVIKLWPTEELALTSWYDAGMRLNPADAEQLPVSTWSIANAENKEHIDATLDFLGAAVKVTAQVGAATAAIALEESAKLIEQKKKEKEEADARKAAEDAEAARVAALEERMAMARQHEEDEQVRLANEAYEQAKATVAKVEREHWAPKRAEEAEAAIKLELAALRTWPVQAELAGLKLKLAPLIATPGVSPDLTKRVEKAMGQAELAKVEAVLTYLLTYLPTYLLTYLPTYLLARKGRGTCQGHLRRRRPSRRRACRPSS